MPDERRVGDLENHPGALRDEEGRSETEQRDKAKAWAASDALLAGAEVDGGAAVMPPAAAAPPPAAVEADDTEAAGEVPGADDLLLEGTGEPW